MREVERMQLEAAGGAIDSPHHLAHLVPHRRHRLLGVVGKRLARLVQPGAHRRAKVAHACVEFPAQGSDRRGSFLMCPGIRFRVCLACHTAVPSTVECARNREWLGVASASLPVRRARNACPARFSDLF